MPTTLAYCAEGLHFSASIYVDKNNCSVNTSVDEFSCKTFCSVINVCAGTFPYELSLLDFSVEEHSLRIMVVDSRGKADEYLRTVNGVQTLPSE